MKSKEGQEHPRGMNGATRPTNGRSRDRAIDRLRDLTLGTALAGLAATGGFATLAAVTYAGTTASTNAGDAPAAVSNDTPSSNGAVGGAQSGTTTNNGTSPYLPFQPVQVPTHQSTHHAHVTTGGSGG
jgi:hypothetical protein